MLLVTLMESKPVHAIELPCCACLDFENCLIGYLLHEIQVTALLLTYHFVVCKSFNLALSIVENNIFIDYIS